MGGVADQVRCHTAVPRKPLVMSLALVPAVVDLLDDHAKLEVGEGDVEVELSYVAATELGVQLANLCARRKARFGSDRLQAAHQVVFTWRGPVHQQRRHV